MRRNIDLKSCDVIPASEVRPGDRVRMTLQEPEGRVLEARTTQANGVESVLAKCDTTEGVIDFYVAPDHSVFKIS